MKCRDYGMKLLRWPAMVGLRMGDDEGEGPCEWKGVIGKEVLRGLKKNKFRF